MEPRTLTFDVSDAIGTGETLTQTAWLFTPPEPASAKAILLCLPGGTYDKRYWHLEVPGHPGYSFAEHLAAAGYVVVAVDHLGVGGSSDPRRSGELGLHLLAKGDAAVAAQLRSALSRAVPELPRDLPLVGVGHSMGACLTTIVQAQAQPYDAVALLGYGVQITNVYERGEDPADLEARIAQSETIFREMNDAAPDASSCLVPRDNLRHIFFAQDVPAAVVAADDAAESRVPVRAASEVTTPGFVERYATEIEIPVFLALGAVLDVSPDPHVEPGNYRASRDVTLHVVEGSAHCHNFAGNRAILWDRIAAWIPTAVAARV